MDNPSETRFTRFLAADGSVVAEPLSALSDRPTAFGLYRDRAMVMTRTFDHRAVTAGEAARFLAVIIEQIEHSE